MGSVVSTPIVLEKLQESIALQTLGNKDPRLEIENASAFLERAGNTSLIGKRTAHKPEDVRPRRRLDPSLPYGERSSNPMANVSSKVAAIV